MAVLKDKAQSVALTLGRGFLRHPANRSLQEALQSAQLDLQEYAGQLVQIVCRFSFLLLAETRLADSGRPLLFDPQADEQACRGYLRKYSLTRLCGRAEDHLEATGDHLWQRVRQVFVWLDGEGAPTLGLPTLGGSFFSADELGPLARCELANKDLLAALGDLADRLRVVTERPPGHRQNPRTLLATESESSAGLELGAVYESLLKLQLSIDCQAQSLVRPREGSDPRREAETQAAEIHDCSKEPTFQQSIHLNCTADQSRKTSGSYYTPVELMECLLDSALDPVIEDALSRAAEGGRDAQATLLALKVCDPACGTGHLLAAAARRLARHLARLRTSNRTPSNAILQQAKREIIAHCLYGVDINPMAVQLCKIGLWLETNQPGTPLTFLDQRIRCGNSLLGARPTLLAQGIPNQAFQPLPGDDKSVCRTLRINNSQSRAAQTVALPSPQHGQSPRRFAQQDPEHLRAQADLWCSVFLWSKSKTPLGRSCPTQESFEAARRDPQQVPVEVQAEVARLRQAYQFFHWSLEFPQVFGWPASFPAAKIPDWQGGFDVILANPPWDKMELLEKEWFASQSRQVARAKTASERKSRIVALKNSDPKLYCRYLQDLRATAAKRAFARHSGAYPLCSLGRVNAFGLFAELALALIRSSGRAGLVVPTGIAVDDSYKGFFQHICRSGQLVSLYDFANRRGIFSGVQGNITFCLMTLVRVLQFWR